MARLIVPIGSHAAVAALREEGCLRGQPHGDEPRQRGHGADQRHPLPRAGGDLTEQYLRHASLHAAIDHISNAIKALLIFPFYSVNLDALYGAVDGQKFGVERPIIKARHSRKYFGLSSRTTNFARLSPRSAARRNSSDGPTSNSRSAISAGG